MTDNLLFHENVQPDIQEIRNFLKKVFQEMDSEELQAADNQSLEEWFAVSEIPNYLTHCTVIDCRSNKDLVGLVIVGKQHPLTWPDGNKAEIFVLGVAGSHRKKGIGKVLIEKAELVARRMGARSTVINTHVDWISSHKFYEKIGYQQIGRLKDYYDNGDAVFFKKAL